MTRSKSFALAFYLGAAVAGAAIGVTVDRLVFPAPQVWTQQAMRTRFYDRLHLSAEQRDAAGKILDERNSVEDSIYTPVRPMRDSVYSLARQRISQLLAPDQKAIYDQMQREREHAQATEKKK